LPPRPADRLIEIDVRSRRAVGKIAADDRDLAARNGRSHFCASDRERRLRSPATRRRRNHRDQRGRELHDNDSRPGAFSQTRVRRPAAVHLLPSADRVLSRFHARAALAVQSLSMNGGAIVAAGGGEVSLWCRSQAASTVGSA